MKSIYILQINNEEASDPILKQTKSLSRLFMKEDVWMQTSTRKGTQHLQLLWECKLKSQGDSLIYPLAWLKLKRLNMPDVGEIWNS